MLSPDCMSLCLQPKSSSIWVPHSQRAEGWSERRINGLGLCSNDWVHLVCHGEEGWSDLVLLVEVSLRHRNRIVHFITSALVIK